MLRDHDYAYIETLKNVSAMQIVPMGTMYCYQPGKGN